MLNKKWKKTKAALAVSALCVLSIGNSSALAETTTLKYSSVFPNSHWLWTESFANFQDKVRHRLNGEVEFQNFHAGQLGKEALGILGSRMADMAIFVPSYEPSKLPLSSVAELPGHYSSSCEGTSKLWQIAREGGALSEAEYKPQGVKILYVHVMPPFELMTTDGTDIQSLDDVKGIKIRANGAAMSQTARALGAVPVQVTTTEAYDALTRGTIDGALWPVSSTRDASLDKAYQYMVDGPQLGSGALLFGIHLNAWKQLSPEAQNVFEQAAQEVQRETCAFQDRKTEQEIDWLEKERGLIVRGLAQEEVDRWAERLSPISSKWADDMDSSGRRGSTVLEAFGQSVSE